MAVVTSIGYESPLSSLSNIEHQLMSVLDEILSGEVLFDLACSNGLEWNRFISVKIKDGAFELNSVRVVDADELSQDLLYEQALFFKGNANSINDSVLTADQILSVQHV